MPLLAVVGQAFVYLFTKGISDYIHVGYAEQAGDIRTWIWNNDLQSHSYTNLTIPPLVFFIVQTAISH